MLVGRPCVSVCTAQCLMRLLAYAGAFNPMFQNFLERPYILAGMAGQRNMVTAPSIIQKLRETVEVYWELVRIIVPIAVITQALNAGGIIKAVSPVLSPVMALYDLPSELAFAWLVGLLVGMWGAVSIIFALVSPAALSVADMTVFSVLLLFAHGLPIEQQIIRKAGPRIAVTVFLRVVGGMICAAILHSIFSVTGWLSAPLDPTWTPMGGTAGWAAFFVGLAETLLWMFIILLALAMLLEGLKASGLITWLNRALAPLFGLSGIEGDARELTAIGMLLGISYGGGLLIREARRGLIPPRQIFLSCAFMGFAHSMIEDTLLMVALGADFSAIFFGRLVFAVAATALIAWIVRRVSDAQFNEHLFDQAQLKPRKPTDKAAPPMSP